MNEHSRVVALSGLGGRPIHATQLYSIAGNVVIGVLLLRLWWLAAPIWFVGGAYLILAGLARFVEEAYRGEPQTIVLAGLPIYQYLALVSVLTGVGLTMLGGAPAPTPSSLADPGLLAAAARRGPRVLVRDGRRLSGVQPTLRAALGLSSPMRGPKWAKAPS